MEEKTEKVKSEAVQIIEAFEVLPKLVVFDLDYTLWPFYCECRSKREIPSLYPHAKGILLALKEKGIDIAIASRSPTADIATAFLNKLNLTPMFVSQEIYSSWTHKTDHFQRIHSRTSVPFNSMLFFDDENRNIQAVIHTYLLLTFLSMKIKDGVRRFTIIHVLHTHTHTFDVNSLDHHRCLKWE
uniref:Magnesium-dependent phosphatase-1 n=1 Tax=Glycine max TaxID=3847 RepID=I1M2N3_SOYBN